MTKYDYEFKLKVVADYEAGEGSFKFLGKKYQIPLGNIKLWVHNYQDFGVDGLKPKKDLQHYTTEFKMNAIQLVLESGLSCRQVGAKIGMTQYGLIAKWVRNYKESGIDGLPQHMRRSTTMKKDPKNLDNKGTLNQSEDLTDSDILIQQLKDLQEENKTLRIQNQFLKELRRLREVDKGQQKDR